MCRRSERQHPVEQHWHPANRTGHDRLDPGREEHDDDQGRQSGRKGGAGLREQDDGDAPGGEEQGRGPALATQDPGHEPEEADDRQRGQLVGVEWREPTVESAGRAEDQGRAGRHHDEYGEDAHQRVQHLQRRVAAHQDRDDQDDEQHPCREHGCGGGAAVERGPQHGADEEGADPQEGGGRHGVSRPSGVGDGDREEQGGDGQSGLRHDDRVGATGVERVGTPRHQGAGRDEADHEGTGAGPRPHHGSLTPRAGRPRRATATRRAGVA